MDTSSKLLVNKPGGKKFFMQGRSAGLYVVCVVFWDKVQFSSSHVWDTKEVRDKIFPVGILLLK